MRQTIILLTMLYWQLSTFANVTFTANKSITIAINSNEAEVVHTATQMFSDDYQRVFNGIAKTHNQKGTIIVGTIGMNSVAENMADANDLHELKQHEEAFLVTVRKGKLLVLGSDKRGTAYGILELSRIMGVSPWVWWADAPVEHKASLVLNEGFRTLQHPSVARRGIFLNDEDWGLMPWSS
ncbi:MAG: hypothetical protein JXR39_07330, partial [Marinilabiliaceae bacterium]|nr:hypothetical protein [Marinilabiliaceae bacterium]